MFHIKTDQRRTEAVAGVTDWEDQGRDCTQLKLMGLENM